MKRIFVKVLALVSFESSVMAATSDRFSCSLKVIDKLSNRESVQEFDFDSVRKLKTGLSLQTYQLYEGTTDLKNKLSVENGSMVGNFKLSYSFAEKRDSNGKLIEARFRNCPSLSSAFCTSNQSCDVTLTTLCNNSSDPFEDPSWRTPQISGERIALYGDAQLIKKIDIVDPSNAIVGVAAISCTWRGSVSDDNF